MITWKQIDDLHYFHSFDGHVHGVCLYYLHYYPEHEPGKSRCGVGCDHEEYASSQLEEYESPDALDMAKRRCESHFADWVATINEELEYKRAAS